MLYLIHTPTFIKCQHNLWCDGESNHSGGHACNDTSSKLIKMEVVEKPETDNQYRHKENHDPISYINVLSH